MSPEQYARFCEIKRITRPIRDITGFRVVINPRNEIDDVRVLKILEGSMDDGLGFFSLQGIQPHGKTISLDVFCEDEIPDKEMRRFLDLTLRAVLHEYAHVLVATPEERNLPNMGLPRGYVSYAEAAACIIGNDLWDLGVFDAMGVATSSAHHEEVVRRVSSVEPYYPILKSMRRKWFLK